MPLLRGLEGEAMRRRCSLAVEALVMKCECEKGDWRRVEGRKLFGVWGLGFGIRCSSEWKGVRV